MLALLLALLNLKSEELGSNPSAAAALFALRLRPREAKVSSQNAFRRVRLAGLY